MGNVYFVITGLIYDSEALASAIQPHSAITDIASRKRYYIDKALQIETVPSAHPSNSRHLHRNTVHRKVITLQSYKHSVSHAPR
jgi:hypothetical protein